VPATHVTVLGMTSWPSLCFVRMSLLYGKHLHFSDRHVTRSAAGTIGASIVATRFLPTLRRRTSANALSVADSLQYLSMDRLLLYPPVNTANWPWPSLLLVLGFLFISSCGPRKQNYIFVNLLFEYLLATNFSS